MGKFLFVITISLIHKNFVITSPCFEGVCSCEEDMGVCLDNISPQFSYSPKSNDKGALFRKYSNTGYGGAIG